MSSLVVVSKRFLVVVVKGFVLRAALWFSMPVRACVRSLGLLPPHTSFLFCRGRGRVEKRACVFVNVPSARRAHI